jgi:signal peptidase I
MAVFHTRKKGVSSLDEKESWRDIRTFLIRLIVFVMIIWAIFTFIFGIVRMHSETMYPRIRDGDLLVYYRLGQDYDIGDVVTFRIGASRRVARVVAKGGDVVDLNEDGELLVNGYAQLEEIFYPTEAIEGGVDYPYTVPDDSYFVLCDYRTISSDSRDYGAVAGSEIDGEIVTILRRRGI